MRSISNYRKTHIPMFTLHCISYSNSSYPTSNSCFKSFLSILLPIYHYQIFRSLPGQTILSSTSLLLLLESIFSFFFFFLLNPRIYLLKGANLRFKGEYHHPVDRQIQAPVLSTKLCRSKTSSAGLGKNKPPQVPLVWDQPHIQPKERIPPYSRQSKQEPAGSSKKTHTVYTKQRKHKRNKNIRTIGDRTTLPGNSSGPAPAGHRGLPGNLKSTSILVVSRKAWACHLLRRVVTDRSDSQNRRQCNTDASHRDTQSGGRSVEPARGRKLAGGRER